MNNFVSLLVLSFRSVPVIFQHHISRVEERVQQTLTGNHKIKLVIIKQVIFSTFISKTI